MATIVSLVISMLLALGGIHATDYYCKPKEFEHINGDAGGLVISRNSSMCGFIGQDDTNFLGIKLDELNLSVEDSIEVESEGNVTKITGPTGRGYLLFGLREPTIRFNFGKLDDTTTRIEFFQNHPNLDYNCDTRDETYIKTFMIKSINLNINKLIQDPVYLEARGHYLITNKTMRIVVPFESTDTIVLRSRPAIQGCSKEYSVTSEAAYELAGPNNVPTDDYTCISIFRNLLAGGESHFDVDFANFIKLSNAGDSLIIDDGNDPRHISIHEDYSKKIISFTGKSLAVIYNSPGPIKPTNVPFRLTVRSRKYGGLVMMDRTLTVPKDSSAYYTLQPQPGKTASIMLNKISGIQITVSDGSDNIILLEKTNLPPTIIANQPDTKLYVTLDPKTKSPAGDIIFKSVDNSCGGIVFGSVPSTTISVSESNPNICYWLLDAQGPQGSLLDISYNNLSTGCLEIYSLSQTNAIYKRCGITQDEILPQFQLNQSYVKLNSSQSSSFQATFKPASSGYIDIQRSYQRNISSIGYPRSYRWSSLADDHIINSLGKSMLLTVADLDVRAGEKLLINGNQISSNLNTNRDIDISNQTAKINLARSLATNDFAFHRGYKIVANEFQKILVADPVKGNLTTPENLTSLILNISASSGHYVNYSITYKGSESGFTKSIVDSRTLLGRRVYADEEYHGSTTSDTLLVILRSAEKNLPRLDVQYKQVACNQTNDHICDDSTRCVQANKLCRGRSYCRDGSDLRLACSSGPSRPTVQTGISGFTAFILCVLMFTLGVLGTLYGPDLYRLLDGRLRPSQYTTFTSTE